MVDLRLRLFLTIGALISLAVIVLVYESYLLRRINEYFFTYIIVWAASVTVLAFFGFRFIVKPSILKLLLISMVIAYLSSIFAYSIAILMDISNIRSVHKPLIWEIIIVALVFPFFVLRGWSFGLLLFVVSICINYFYPTKE